MFDIMFAAMISTQAAHQPTHVWHRVPAHTIVQATPPRHISKTPPNKATIGRIIGGLPHIVAVTPPHKVTVGKAIHRIVGQGS